MAPRRLPFTAALLALLALGLIGAALTAADHRLALPLAGGGPATRIELPPSADFDIPSVAGDTDSSSPLVVIDPGHGGHDPGASGQGQVEKLLVLQLARALRDRLQGQGGVRVALTRDADRYLLLEERVEIARRLGADLFLSIHADSAGAASDVAGASIYTLSDDASSEAARRFAERENASDRINGQDIGAQSDSVSAILVELAQRRAQDRADEFARLVEREGEGLLRFHPQARRAAALSVLRAPDVPSVLFESGFISNAVEAERLSSAEGRARFAEALARAIRVYFARNPVDEGQGTSDEDSPPALSGTTS